MNRHQRAPATRREAPLDACVALGRKAPLASRGPKALSFTAKQLVLLHRAASLKHREFANCSAPSLARPLGKKNAALRLRALANTQKPHSLKKLQRGNAPPPRAPRTHHPRAAATRGAAAARRRRRNTQTSPRALQPPTHTPNPAGLPLQGGGSPRTTPRRRFDGSNDTYTARGSTTVLSEKQRHDPDHGNSCGGERVVYQQR